MKMTAFWDIAPCNLVELDRRFRDVCYLHQGLDDGSGTHLWNVGILQREYTVSYPRKLLSSYSLSWESEISQKLEYFTEVNYGNVKTWYLRKSEDNFNGEKQYILCILIFWTLTVFLIFLKHDVSETGSVSVLRWIKEGEGPTLVGPLEKSSLFHWTCMLIRTLYIVHRPNFLKTRHGSAWVERRYSSYSFLTSALDRVSGQRHAPAALCP
jgi:hypothetical protein